MLKPFPVILSFCLLPLGVQAKVPEQGAVFSLARVGDTGEKKVAANELLPAGSKLRFRVEARKQPCTIVATAFLRGNAREVAGFPPSIYRLQAEEQAYSDFTLAKPVRASEFFVVVVPQDSATSERLTELVKKWKQQPQNSQPARTALHDNLSHWLASRDQSLNYSGPVPSELGGVRTTSARPINPIPQSPSAGASVLETSGKASSSSSRQVEIGQSRDWQKTADWVPCASNKPGVFIYRLGK